MTCIRVSCYCHVFECNPMTLLTASIASCGLRTTKSLVFGLFTHNKTPNEFKCSHIFSTCSRSVTPFGLQICFFVVNLLFVVFCVFTVSIVFLRSETHIHFNISKWDYWLFLCTFCEFLSTHNPRDWVFMLEDWCLFNNLIHKTQNKKKDWWHHCFGWNTSLKYESQSHPFISLVFVAKKNKKMYEYRFKNKTKKINEANHTFRINSCTILTPSPVKLLMGIIERLLWRTNRFLKWFSIFKQFINDPLWYLVVSLLLSQLDLILFLFFFFFFFEWNVVLLFLDCGQKRRTKEQHKKKEREKMNDKRRKYKPQWVPRIITGLSLEWTWTRDIHSPNCCCFFVQVVGQELSHVKCHKHNTVLCEQHFICWCDTHFDLKIECLNFVIVPIFVECWLCVSLFWDLQYQSKSRSSLVVFDLLDKFWAKIWIVPEIKKIEHSYRKLSNDWNRK